MEVDNCIVSVGKIASFWLGKTIDNGKYRVDFVMFFVAMRDWNQMTRRLYPPCETVVVC